MSDRHIRSLLVMYIEDELEPQVAIAARAHLAACPDCRDELASLVRAKEGVRMYFRSLASSPAPEVAAASVLHLAGAASPRGSKWWNLPGTLRWALSVTLLIALAVVGMASIPSWRGAVAQALAHFFQIPSPAGDSLIYVSTVDFPVLAPGYLPDEVNGLQVMFTGFPSLSLKYFGSLHFLVIDESDARFSEVLPAGDAVKLGNVYGVLEVGLSGTIFLNQPASCAGSSSLREGIPYSNGLRLTFLRGGTKVQITSDLPRELVLQVARNLAPAGETTTGPASLPVEVFAAGRKIILYDCPTLSPTP